MKNNYDIVVIGAGAAGMIAAGTAAEGGKKVLLLEKMEKTGRKIRITGKGRCNLTNVRTGEDFLEKVRSGADFLRPALSLFDSAETVRFFESIGVPLETERGGRVFPRSGRAWDIADGLTRWVEGTECEIRYHSPVKKLLTEEGRITGVVYMDRQKEITVPCSAVVVATGGMSYPSTGSTGDGYQLAYRLGHRIEPVRPSLVPLEAGNQPALRLKSLLLKNVQLSLVVDNEQLQQEFGEMEFTGSGVSGAIVLRVSRKAVDALIEERSVEMLIDLKPALSEQQIIARIGRELEKDPGLSVQGLLRKFVPRELVSVLSSQLGGSSNRPAAALDNDGQRQVATVLKAWKLTVTDYRPFTEAVVTAGGVVLPEIDENTMESRIIKGLFFAGEVMDIDADTGGYNLQLAFSTGRLAGHSV